MGLQRRFKLPSTHKQLENQIKCKKQPSLDIKKRQGQDCNPQAKGKKQGEGFLHGVNLQTVAQRGELWQLY